MDAELYQKIQENVETKSLTVRGKEYLTDKVYLPPEPQVETLIVNSLTGLRDYVNSYADCLSRSELLIHVESPTKVRLYEQVTTKEGKRHQWLYAKTDLTEFRFGDYLSQEQFLISFQTLFLDDADFRDVVKTVSNIVAEQSVSNSDDGMSQEAVIKSSAVKVEDCVIKNPVQLYPIQTFHEVTQPGGFFILRFAKTNDGVKVALFEGQNGLWENEARLNIKDWLEKEINPVSEQTTDAQSEVCEQQAKVVILA